MIDNTEINLLLDKLENHSDEEEAVLLLKEFNAASSDLGKLLLNLDKNLAHEEWKKKCDLARKRLDEVVTKINSL